MHAMPRFFDLAKAAILATLLAIAPFYSVAQANWQQQANFPGVGRYWCSSFTIGDKIYVGLGYNPTGGSGGSSAFFNDFYEYNTTTNTWTQRPSYPGAGRLYVTGFSINGKGYFACGWFSGYHNDMWEYDPVANNWTQKTSVPGPGRWGAVGFSIGNYGYVVTGDTQGNGQGCINGAYRYDQTSNLWMQLPNFPGTPVYGAAGFAIGNKGYVGTGYDGSAVHDEFYCWNEDSFSWSQMADFGGSPRYQNVGFAVGNRGYIGLGSSGNGDLWEYNPITNNWVQTLSYPGIGINVNAAAATSTAAYVGLGQVANQQWWKYTPIDCSSNTASITAEGSTSFCPGGSVTLTASEGSSYSWNNGQTTASIEVSESGQYSVVLQFEDGCTDLASTTVTVLPAPTIVANATETTVCVGESITFTANGGADYSWSSGIVNGEPYLAALPYAGYVTVLGIGANGCSATDSLYITINPLPEVQLEFVSQAQLCQNTGNVELNEGIPTGGVYSGPGISNNAISTNSTGNFEITYTVTDANGCSSSAIDNIDIEVCTALDGQASPDVMLYPNPALNGQPIWIGNTEGVRSIELLDALGRHVMHVGVDASNVQFVPENLATGTYFLKLIYDNTAVSRPLMLR